MVFEWSLLKQAGDENAPQGLPPQAPQPQSQPQVQQPVAPRPAPAPRPALYQDPAEQSKELQRQRRARIDAIKASPEGQSMRQFVQNPNFDPSISPADRISLYRQDDNTLKAFEEIASETLGANETLQEFIQRVTYKTPQAVKMYGEEDQPEAEKPTENAADDREDRTNADVLARMYLEDAVQLFVDNHTDWINTIASQRDQRGNPSVLAEEIINGVHNAFSGNGPGGVKKWKRFFEANNHLLPEDVRQAIQSKGVIAAIDENIMQSQQTGEEPSSIAQLKSLIQSQDKAIRSKLEEFVQKCALTLTANHGGKDRSLNYNLGDGRETGDLIASPEDIDQSIPEAQLDAANNAWAAFLQNPQNQEVTEYLKNDVTYSDAEDEKPIVAILSERGKLNPNDIIKQAIHDAFTGYSKESDRAKWQDYFELNPSILAKMGITPNADDMDENSPKLLQLLGMLAAGQGDAKAQRDLRMFVTDSAEQFLKRAYEDAIMSEPSSEPADMIKLKTLGRVGKLVQNYVLREYAWLKARGLKTATNAGRRYALLRAKNEALQIGLRQVFSSDQPIRITNKTRIYRHPETGHLMIQQLVATSKGQETWGKDREFRDEDITKLQWAARPQQWVPKAMDLMLNKLKDPLMLRRRGKHDPDPNKLTGIDRAVYDYLQENPHPVDRLKPWREAMGQRITALREQRGLSPEQLANIISPQKAVKKQGRRKGSRISKEPLAMIAKLEGGQPTQYDERDLEELAKALGVTIDQIYERPLEYDRFSLNDISDLNVTVGTTFSSYGPFLLHRKKEAIRRGIRNDFFSQKTMYYYLSLMGVHWLYSSKPKARGGADEEGGEKQSDQKFGKFLYQLVGKPVGIDTSDDDEPMGMEGVLSNISHVPTAEESDPRYKVPDFRGPRHEMTPEGGKGQVLPPDLVHRYQYDPEKWPEQAFLSPEQEPKQPTDIRRKWYEPDADEMHNLSTQPGADGLSRDLPYWEQNKLNELKGHSESTMPEDIEVALQRQSPSHVAKSVIKRIWEKGKGGARHLDDTSAAKMLQDKMERQNAWLQKKGIDKQYTSVDEYAQKYLQDEIKTGKHFRDKSKNELEWLQQHLPTMSDKDKMRYVVPVSVRRNAKFVAPGGQKPPGIMEVNPVTDDNGIEKYDATIVNLFALAMNELDRYGDIGARMSKFASAEDVYQAAFDFADYAISRLMKLRNLVEN